MKSPDEKSPQEDFQQFYSKDPYVVLGISRFANNEEVEKAVKNLRRKFHTDINKDPEAEEIYKKIGTAFDILRGKRGSLSGNSPKPSDPFNSKKPEPKPTPPTEQVDPIVRERKNYYYDKYLNGKRIDTLDDEILWELRDGFLRFRDYLERRAKKWGIKEEKIIEVVSSERGQRCLQETFMSEFWNYFSHTGSEFRKGESFFEMMQDWAKLDIDMSGFINLPAVVEKLESLAKIKLKYDSLKEFEPFVQSWMKAGWKPSQEIMDALNR